MSEHTDVLYAIAGISISFAGFSGVVAAFSRFRLDPRARFFRVRTMVGAGLFVLMFSLLPLVLGQFPIPEVMIWRFAGVALALGTTAMIIWGLVHVRPLQREGIVHAQTFTSVITSVFAVAVAILLAGILQSWSAVIPGTYVTLLFLGLFLCSYYFFMLISAIDMD